MLGRAERLPETISQNAGGVHGVSESEMTIQEVRFDYTLSCEGGRSFRLQEESAIDHEVNVGTTIRGFPNCGSWLIPLKTIQHVTGEREPHIVLPPRAPQDVGRWVLADHRTLGAWNRRSELGINSSYRRFDDADF
jgi:hypothetical protein